MGPHLALNYSCRGNPICIIPYYVSVHAVTVSILQEEQMFAAGGPFTCLLISMPLLPLPAGRQTEGGGPSKGPHGSSRTGHSGKEIPQGAPGAQGAPGGAPSSPQDLPFVSATETQQRVERWWRQGPQGALAERLVHAEIARFKGTYVLVR